MKTIKEIKDDIKFAIFSIKKYISDKIEVLTDQEMAPFTGVFMALFLMAFKWNWYVACIIWGVFGYLIFIRIEESIFQYAKFRRDKK